ncbi:hypothetical protein DP113_25810 [Brasilonema octagenarum UFV-E1]|uniref:Uncharacterized protein n=1 Tax=Brasilonema sennae CENA114 TaxID=415709 RepID=A0A856ML75_9CYAN|nr:hypothetical protein DP114_25900 [Brasilonema sennae CENA114]QDL17225.1 hypothetical protein DP113_25810 [Brasilonema octagenarum UFV-E1]
MDVPPAKFAVGAEEPAPCGGTPKVCRGKQPKRRALTVDASGVTQRRKKAIAPIWQQFSIG